jgi:hypothetical protein
VLMGLGLVSVGGLLVAYIRRRHRSAG